MDHLEPRGAPAYFAEAGHMYAVLELRLLLPREMEKAKRELTAAVAYAYEQVASTAISRFRQQYLTADETARAGNQRPYPDELRSILVAQWQQEQQVLNTVQPELLELGGERRSYAFKYR
jgi:hypothetical protein